MSFSQAWLHFVQRCSKLYKLYKTIKQAVRNTRCHMHCLAAKIRRIFSVRQAMRTAGLLVSNGRLWNLPEHIGAHTWTTDRHALTICPTFFKYHSVSVCVCVFAYNFMWSAWSGPSQPAICRKNLTLQLHVQHVCVMSSKFRITSRWRQVSDQLLLSWTALRWKRLMTQCTTMHDNHIGMNML